MALDDDLLEALGRAEEHEVEEKIAQAGRVMKVLARQAAMLREELRLVGLPDAVADACTIDYVGVLLRHSAGRR